MRTARSASPVGTARGASPGISSTVTAVTRCRPPFPVGRGRRGGETLACGTGACATVAAAACEQRMAARVTVRVPGGDLFVRAGPHTYELAGPAEHVFEGSTT